MYNCRKCRNTTTRAREPIATAGTKLRGLLQPTSDLGSYADSLLDAKGIDNVLGGDGVCYHGGQDIANGPSVKTRRFYQPVRSTITNWLMEHHQCTAAVAAGAGATTTIRKKEATEPRSGGSTVNVDFWERLALIRRKKEIMIENELKRQMEIKRQEFERQELEELDNMEYEIHRNLNQLLDCP